MGAGVRLRAFTAKSRGKPGHTVLRQGKGGTPCYGKLAVFGPRLAWGIGDGVVYDHGRGDPSAEPMGTDADPPASAKAPMLHARSDRKGKGVHVDESTALHVPPSPYTRMHTHTHTHNIHTHTHVRSFVRPFVRSCVRFVPDIHVRMTMVARARSFGSLTAALRASWRMVSRAPGASIPVWLAQGSQVLVGLP